MSNTSSGAKNLCGHFNDFGAFVLALDPRLLDSAWEVWKDARRQSYVKYSSATSVIGILGVSKEINNMFVLCCCRFSASAATRLCRQSRIRAETGCSGKKSRSNLRVS